MNFLFKNKRKMAFSRSIKTYLNNTHRIVKQIKQNKGIDGSAGKRQ